MRSLSAKINEQDVQQLAIEANLPDDKLLALVKSANYDTLLFSLADKARRQYYSDKVYLRGLIEITNYCKNNCYYCGIRAANRNCIRYRLTKEEILACCKEGYSLGFRTFVMQGGEDPYFTDEIICDIVASIRERYPDCAITLSLGERSYESYKALYQAGANRYLLRHESAAEQHYNQLHPKELSYQKRIECLNALKEIGFQVGSGFMVGSPYQTAENLLADLRFLQKLSPDMIGIGPFVHHKDTPFANCPNGTAELTLRMIAILRLLFPYALLPSTTALGTIHPNGRELGLKAGANVVMPNLSPIAVRQKYELYDNKLYSGAESAQAIKELKEKIAAIGYRAVSERGDVARKILR